MDRTEFKERITRIDDLIVAGNNDEALDLLDSINWNKVQNINYLVEGASRYEKVSKIEDAKELLEIAHERSPIGRIPIYRLGLICVRLNEIEQANEYYQKFIELAPNDNIKYILKYEINKAKGADDSILISILEELHSNELIEEWAFELACLYQKTEQIDKCITLLDEIILWFGEGPYVEKAYEIKRKYKPLTRDQEIRYRNMISSDSSIIEIHPGDHVAKNEMLGHTIRIPEIEETSEIYNTQNLQAEIRKNIEEIMKASEVEAVSDNIDAIRELVGDIPHLSINEEKTIEERKYDTQKLDLNLKNKFKEYLSEEFDGQISLLDTGKESNDDQIEGQLTIDDITNRWEKTKRAAEQALLEAKEEELKHYKEEALAKASEVLDKLIESGKELSSETEKLSESKKEEEQKEEEENKENLELQKTFHIPKIAEDGEIEGEGLDIPIISTKEIEEKPQAWIPPELDAEQTLKDINEMLQGEIDKLTEEVLEEESKDNTTTNLPLIDISDIEEEDDPIDEEIEISDDKNQESIELTERQREILSYFSGVSGMEKILYEVLYKLKSNYSDDDISNDTNLVIYGQSGNGKTRLAQNIIKALQEETGYPKGNIGKISSEKLNEKEVSKIFEKIEGGALIIQKASKLSKDTIVSLSLCMEGDNSGTLVVLEDTQESLEGLFSTEPRLSRKFSARVSIPEMSIDELVGFAKLYAAENGYDIDAMGVLALYDKINISGTQANPASITVVKDIVDSAISSAEGTKFKGIFGLFGSKSENESGMAVLQERDFREE